MFIQWSVIVARPADYKQCKCGSFNDHDNTKCWDCQGKTFSKLNKKRLDKLTKLWYTYTNKDVELQTKQ